MARMVRKQVYIEERQDQLREFWAFARKRAAMRVPQTGRAWTREGLYEERLARHSR